MNRHLLSKESDGINRKERSLVKRLKERSPKAFKELVDIFSSRLYRVGIRILRSREDTEDALQETFLKSFHSISTFRAQSSLYSWLYRIMVNESLMKLRQRRKHEASPIEDYLPRFNGGKHAEGVWDWSRPDLALDAEELVEVLQRCISHLPVDYQLPYILKDVEKMSERQVCEILKIPKTTMKNRVHRARLAIRQRVEDHLRSQKQSLITSSNRFVNLPSFRPHEARVHA